MKAIIKDCCSPDYLCILCRNEEELKNIKSTTTITATEGARVLKDQLYPIKINNARADAVLIPNRSLKVNAALEITAEN